MSKKNLDRLFQEKFKDFDAKPNKKVWQNIQNRLEEEKDDRSVFIIPFWVKLSGIAVSLLILLLVGNSLTNSEKEIIPIIVDSPQKKEINTKSNSSKKESNDETLNKDEKMVSNPNQSKKVSSSKQFRSNSNKGTYLTASSNNTFKNSKQKSNSSNYNKSASSNEKNNEIAKSSKKENNPNYAFNKFENKTLKNEQNDTLNDKTNNTLAQNSSKENEANTSLLNTNTKEEEKENAIETAIAEAENEELNNEKEENYNRWSIYANAAPVYYNSFGEGSHLDNQFDKNHKSGEINSSYGVKVAYTLNNKFKIRAGLNKLNLSYATNDVLVYENVNVNPRIHKNINLNKIGDLNINVISGNESFLQIPNLGFVKNVSLSQRISYYEVPLEVEYAIIDKRFSLNVIGGVSTFFLNDNELVSEFDGYKTKIGEANNINNISFTSNFGIGFYYDFSQHIQLNIEPTFKYQINAYNNTSGDFNPYIIGLYSGLSYKF